MNIHQLFKTREEYIEYFLKIVNIHDHPEVWREEDLPKLKPYFSYNKECQGRPLPMSDEVVKSFDYYLQCKKEYADALFELKRATEYFDIHDLCDAFGFVITNEDNEEDDKNDVPYKYELASDFIPEFPMIAVGAIECDRDRNGKFQAVVMDFVSKKEFD